MTRQSDRPVQVPSAALYSYITTNYIVLNACSGPTDVKVSILIRSMGPISDTDMVRDSDIFCKVSVDLLVQHYSMDCYFRQYWRDSRLSFKGLKMNSNQLHINQLSLNVKMLGNHRHVKYIHGKHMLTFRSINRQALRTRSCVLRIFL